MNLLRAASTISLLTLVSRISGLARDIAVSNAFGASAWMDAFNVAFRIPNFLRRLFGEGAFAQAFVPILAQTREREGAVVTGALVDAVATILFWALLLTCVVGVVAAPVMVFLMASGLKEFDAAVTMTRIMFPYIGLISMVSLAAGILNTWKRFVVPAATPVLLNLASIAAALWLGPQFERWGIQPIYAQAVGVMVGGILQLAIQFPALRRVGVLPHVRLLPGAVRAAWRHPGVGRVLRQMAPALVGVSVAQVSILINTQLAAWLGDGRIAWISYADRLMEFPTALLGVAVGTVLLPTLARHGGEGDETHYSELLDWGLRLTLLLALPAAIALWLLALPLVTTLYQYGRFIATHSLMTRVALIGYSVGLLGIVAVKILAPGFYARQDIRTPVRIAVITVAVTVALAFLLMEPLGHAGLTLATSLGALFNAATLYVLLRRRGHYAPVAGWGMFLAKIVVAGGVLAGVLAMLVGPASTWLQAGLSERVVRLALVMAAGGAGYFGALWLLGFRPKDFSRRDRVPDPAPAVEPDET